MKLCLINHSRLLRNIFISKLQKLSAGRSSKLPVKRWKLKVIIHLDRSAIALFVKPKEFHSRIILNISPKNRKERRKEGRHCMCNDQSFDFSGSLWFRVNIVASLIAITSSSTHQLAVQDPKTTQKAYRNAVVIIGRFINSKQERRRWGEKHSRTWLMMHNQDKCILHKK